VCSSDLFADGNPGGIKVLLQNLGLCKNIVRLPLAPVNKHVEEKLLSLAKVLN
jgi:dihydrodipicolinate synthase/N-acetylneuraminate lyase